MSSPKQMNCSFLIYSVLLLLLKNSSCMVSNSSELLPEKAVLTTPVFPGNNSDLKSISNGTILHISEGNLLESLYNKLIYAQDLIVIPLFSPVGIIGNSLVAVNLFAKRKANSSFIYMVFILSSDILGLISDMFLPFTRLLQMYGSDQVKKPAAIIYFWNADVISYLFRRYSLNVFCVLSFERFMAIKKPLQLHRSWTVRYSSVFIVFALLFSIVQTMFTPMFLKIGTFNDIESNKTSYSRTYTELYLNNEIYTARIMLVSRFVDGPLQIVFFTVINGLIIHCLKKNMKSFALSENTGRTMSISKVQIRLCKIFLIMSVTNMLAFLPFSVCLIIAKLFPSLGLDIKSYTVQFILYGGNILRVFNSLTDFTVFVVISKEVRKDFKTMLLCKRESYSTQNLDRGKKNTTVTGGESSETIS